MLLSSLDFQRLASAPLIRTGSRCCRLVVHNLGNGYFVLEKVEIIVTAIMPCSCLPIAEPEPFSRCQALDTSIPWLFC